MTPAEIRRAAIEGCINAIKSNASSLPLRDDWERGFRAGINEALDRCEVERFVNYPAPHVDDTAMAIVRELAAVDLVQETGGEDEDGTKDYSCSMCGEWKPGWRYAEHSDDCIFPLWVRAKKLVEAEK